MLWHYLMVSNSSYFYSQSVELLCLKFIFPIEQLYYSQIQSMKQYLKKENKSKNIIPLILM